MTQITPPHCYIKKYEQSTTGTRILTNPEPAIAFNQQKVNALLDAETQADLQNVLLELLREFRAIYEYDLDHSISPEPFGIFESQKERADLIRMKQLIDDMALYLGNIFVNYHEALYHRKRGIPICRSASTVINYNELYDRALAEYYGALLGIRYPLIINEKNGFLEEITVSASPLPKEQILVWKTMEYRGVQTKMAVPVPENILLPKKSEHAPGASFILPSLIEHFMGIRIQNRLLFQSMNELSKRMSFHSIELTEIEKEICQAFTGQKESITFMASEEFIMGTMYNLFVRSGVLQESLDNEMILTGTGRQGRKHLQKTLGSLLKSPYTESQVLPEYMDFLKDLFDTNRINLRNSIMHGNNKTFDYLSIGLAAIMLQLLWSIAEDAIFKKN